MTLNLGRVVIRQGLPLQHALNPSPQNAGELASDPAEAERLRCKAELQAQIAKVKADLGFR